MAKNIEEKKKKEEGRKIFAWVSLGGRRVCLVESTADPWPRVSWFHTVHLSWLGLVMHTKANEREKERDRGFCERVEFAWPRAACRWSPRFSNSTDRSFRSQPEPRRAQARAHVRNVHVLFVTLAWTYVMLGRDEATTTTSQEEYIRARAIILRVRGREEPSSLFVTFFTVRLRS